MYVSSPARRRAATRASSFRVRQALNACAPLVMIAPTPTPMIPAMAVPIILHSLAQVGRLQPIAPGGPRRQRPSRGTSPRRPRTSAPSTHAPSHAPASRSGRRLERPIRERVAQRAGRALFRACDLERGTPHLPPEVTAMRLDALGRWKTRRIHIARGGVRTASTPRPVMGTVRQAPAVSVPGSSTRDPWTWRCSKRIASPGRAPVSAMKITSGPHKPHSSATASTSSHDSNGSIRSDRRGIGILTAAAGFDGTSRFATPNLYVILTVRQMS